jgi:hypothetical protein
MNHEKRLGGPEGASRTLRSVFRSRVAAVGVAATLLVAVCGTVAMSVTPGAGTNWGIVDGDVIRNGDAYLRTGPTFLTAGGESVNPPLGDGSLGLRTGSSNDQTAFGNQRAFVDDLVSGLTSLGFSVFTTTENNQRGQRNMPSIVITIDPNLVGAPNNDTASMIYTPRNGDANRWTTFDATDSTQGRVWTLAGVGAAGADCSLGSRCTWDRIQEVLEDGDGIQARIRSIQIAKLQAQAFSGAVDALIVRQNVYDFEPLGVGVSVR